MTDDLFANLPPKANELGTPRTYCRDRPALARTNRFLRAAVRLALGAALILLGYRVYGNPADHPGLGRTALLLLSLFAGSVSLVSAVRSLLARRRGGNVRGVIRCPGGLVCVLTDRCLVVPWDAIESVWDGGLRFRTHAGDDVSLPTSLEHIFVIAEDLFRETFQRMSICASAMLFGGRPVGFGLIRLTREEVAVGDQRVPWGEVRRVALAWGRLRIYRDGKRRPALDVPLAEVPNVHALWAVMERLREGGFGSIIIGPGTSEPEEPE